MEIFRAVVESPGDLLKVWKTGASVGMNDHEVLEIAVSQTSRLLVK